MIADFWMHDILKPLVQWPPPHPPSKTQRLQMIDARWLASSSQTQSQLQLETVDALSFSSKVAEEPASTATVGSGSGEELPPPKKLKIQKGGMIDVQPEIPKHCPAHAFLEQCIVEQRKKVHTLTSYLQDATVQLRHLEAQAQAANVGPRQEILQL